MTAANATHDSHHNRNSFSQMVVRLLMGGLGLLAVLPSALATEPDGALWAANGSVDAVVEYDGVLYLGGSFNVIGTPANHQALLNRTTGAVDNAWPGTDGSILTVVSDGSGGWFIGGNFTQVGGWTRNGLAHLRSDKTVDPNWDPNADNTVWALAFSPDGTTLYVGGEFLNVGGAARNRIAAVSTTDGSARVWNPDSNGLVYALICSSDGNTVYAGGSFATIGGQSRSRVTALDATTGLAAAWNPNIDSGRVRCLTLAADESTLYIGGLFQMVGGQVRQRIAEVNTTTGAVTAWNPTAGGFPAGMHVLSFPHFPAYSSSIIWS